MALCKPQIPQRLTTEDAPITIAVYARYILIFNFCQLTLLFVLILPFSVKKPHIFLFIWGLWLFSNLTFILVSTPIWDYFTFRVTFGFWLKIYLKYSSTNGFCTQCILLFPRTGTIPILSHTIYLSHRSCRKSKFQPYFFLKNIWWYSANIRHFLFLFPL